MSVPSLPYYYVLIREFGGGIDVSTKTQSLMTGHACCFRRYHPQNHTIEMDTSSFLSSFLNFPPQSSSSSLSVKGEQGTAATETAMSAGNTMPLIMGVFPAAVVVQSLLMVLFISVSSVSAQEQPLNLDRFTFDVASQTRPDGFTDYAPPEWLEIDCDDPDDCPEAFPDKWEYGRNWTLDENACVHCPEGTLQCGEHHQSPINLKREFGLEPGTHPNANECIDLHWMKYEDSFCTFDQLIDADAFTSNGMRFVFPSPLKRMTTSKTIKMD